MEKEKKSIYNVIFGFISQLVIIGLGIIVPRIILTNYGSDVNGYTSTIHQIFTYMALLEAGIGQSTLNALYGPITRDDRKKTSSILVASRTYYRKITKIYFLLVLVMTFVLPLVLNTEIDYKTAAFVIFFEGLASVVNFYYTELWMQLLSADGRYYVLQNIKMMTTVGTYGIKIVLACLGMNIALIQLGYFGLSLLQMLAYKIYCRKQYYWVDFNEKPDPSALDDRYSFMLTQVAMTVFSSTDMIVLSVFGSTLLASIYSVYGLIYNNLNTFMNAIYFGLVYLLGQAWASDRNTYPKMHDAFDGCCMWAITSTMSVAYVLTLPFIEIYTSGVNDINYIYPELPLLFALVQMLSWSRYVSGNLTAIAGYAKPVSRISVIEAIINLTFSIILVQKYGIVGTLFATVIALPLKVIYCMYCGNKVIMKRSIWNSLKILVVNYALFAIVVAYVHYCPLVVHGLGMLLIKAIIVSIIIYPLFLIINILCNKALFKYGKVILKRILNRMNK